VTYNGELEVRVLLLNKRDPRSSPGLLFEPSRSISVANFFTKQDPPLIPTRLRTVPCVAEELCFVVIDDQDRRPNSSFPPFLFPLLPSSHVGDISQQVPSSTTDMAASYAANAADPRCQLRGC
jgi:hypothetical protein